MEVGRVVVGGVVGGALAGSFLATVIERWPRGEPYWRGRSRCPRCRRALGARDLVPLISFFLLRGRCRYCRRRIPRWPEVVEGAAMALFLATLFFRSRVPLADAVLLLFIVALLLTLAVIDLRHFVLPNQLVVLLAGAGAARSWLGTGPPLGSAAAAALAGVALLGALALLPGRGGAPATSRRGSAMGYGDVKLAGAMGVILGLPGLLAALFLAFLAGGAVGAGLLVRGRAGWRSPIPFGPFLAGATVTLLWFPQLPAAFYPALGLG